MSSSNDENHDEVSSLREQLQQAQITISGTITTTTTTTITTNTTSISTIITVLTHYHY